MLLAARQNIPGISIELIFDRVEKRFLQPNLNKP
jgi:hypothetical protein